MKKLVINLLAVFVFFALVSCGGKTVDATSGDSPEVSAENKAEPSAEDETTEATQPAASNRKGKLVYKQYCVICHGADGKLAVSDAKDLSISTIDIEERINQITNGKGLMTPYKDILSAEQIQSVAEYIVELRK